MTIHRLARDTGKRVGSERNNGGGVDVAAGGIVTMDRMAIPGVGWLIYATDPNGLHFGLRQADESATARPPLSPSQPVAFNVTVMLRAAGGRWL